MTITKAEVKTIYTITISKSEAFGIAMHARTDNVNFLHAFDWVKEDTTVEEFANRFDKFNGLKTSEIDYLASRLGFDGVVNCGFPKNGVWQMSVYRYGDCMN